MIGSAVSNMLSHGPLMALTNIRTWLSSSVVRLQYLFSPSVTLCRMVVQGDEREKSEWERGDEREWESDVHGLVEHSAIIVPRIPRKEAIYMYVEYSCLPLWRTSALSDRSGQGPWSVEEKMKNIHPLKRTTYNLTISSMSLICLCSTPENGGSRDSLGGSSCNLGNGQWWKFSWPM